MSTIRANLAKLRQYKSHDYSETAYNQELQEWIAVLEIAGATREQVATFVRLAGRLPIAGGQFKSYDGT